MSEQYCCDCDWFDIVECICTHPKCGGICHPLDGEDCEHFWESEW
jgi:hypothetical protein